MQLLVMQKRSEDPTFRKLGPFPNSGEERAASAMLVPTVDLIGPGCAHYLLLCYRGRFASTINTIVGVKKIVLIFVPSLSADTV
jgi:hypothetical protein